MDPVTHTLVGAALGEGGLKRRTPLGMATLLIGANLPDVDVASYVLGPTFALTFRRGWTHGVLALAVLPFVLTGLMLLWDARIRRARDPTAPRAVPRELFVLSAIAVATHPLLDYLNVYGMRFLMPFNDRWFYGDTLFIVDPWVWAMLASGVFLARRRRGSSPSDGGRVLDGAGRPARMALVAVAVYVGAMAGSMLLGRATVARALATDAPGARQIMVAPVALNPFRRYVVIAGAGAYRVGALDWLRRPPFVSGELVTFAVRGDVAGVAQARESERGRQFLRWARFPFYTVSSAKGGCRVHIVDARYALESDASFGAVTVEVEAP